MSERRSSADLGPNLEAALSSFPFPERDWEKDATAVEAKLSTAQLGSSDAALLAAPLPSEPGEPSAVPSATATPLTHSGVRTQSLAEMARRSVLNKQAAEREMARESLALAAQQRPALPAEPPSTASAARPIAAAPVAAVSARAAAASPWPKLAAAAGVIAFAAGVLFWLRQPGAPVPLVSTVLPTATPTSQAKPNAVDAPRAVPTASLQLTPSGVDPNSLPGESAPKPAEAAHEKPSAATARAPTAGAASGAPSAEKIVLEDEPENAAPKAAATVEKTVEKALPPDPALRPADSTGGAVPTKPSTGAVQAALGAVMSGARHCVAGEDTASSAVVVFSSDGHVQSVSVSGPAAGQSSGACIQAQLSRARVQPFAAASFSVSATVRPD
jgi:hypothetical protein